MRNFILFISGLALSVSQLRATEIPLSGIMNLSLGRGVGTVAGAAFVDLKAPDCLAHDGLASSQGVGETSVTVNTLTSTSEYNKTLTRKFGFGVADAAEKVKLFDASFNHQNVRQALQSSTTSIAEIRVRRELPYEYLVNPRPSTKLLSLKGSSDPYAVYKTCGDAAVLGYKKVVEVNAFLICEASSQAIKKQMDSGFKGFGTWEGVTFSADASGKLDSTAQLAENGCGISVLARGGQGNIQTDDLKTFVQSAINFATNATQATAFVEAIEVMKYSELGNPELHSVLDSQVIDFPRASELMKPFIEGGRNLIGLYLQSSSDDVQKSLVSYGDALRRCSAEPWSEGACHQTAFPGIDILDTF